MLHRGTLNILCGAPSAGKTTLTLQAVHAHEIGLPFFVDVLRFPPGPIVYVSTDRPDDDLRRLVLDPMGISKMNVISTVLDRSFNPIAHNPAAMRKAITDRISSLGAGTLILDLYNDFIHGRMADAKLLSQDGRLNVQWARDLNCAILGLWYPFKQRQNAQAKRVQDRIAGALALQASANWKMNIIDPAESHDEFWIVDVVPGPGEGPPRSYQLVRGNDPIGLFSLHGPDDTVV